MSGPPVQQYVPPSPYSQPSHEARSGKKGPSTALVVILIIVIFVVLGILGMVFLFSLVANLDGEPWENSREFETEVHIEDGGHFRYLLSDAWEDELEVNMTLGLLNGSRFDVYIMDRQQYMNAYGNESTGAFSALFSWQNVSAVRDLVTMERRDVEYYIIIDNMDMAHVPGSATPEGPIHVEMFLEITSRFNT
jgi:hypothetical protein